MKTFLLLALWAALLALLATHATQVLVVAVTVLAVALPLGMAGALLRALWFFLTLGRGA